MKWNVDEDPSVIRANFWMGHCAVEWLNLLRSIGFVMANLLLMHK
jgi:hypothetical protein